MDPAECCEDGSVDVERVLRARELMIPEAQVQALAETFRALADPTRVRLISMLATMELCVGELAAALGMSVSAVSHQLRMLRGLRLVRARREGRHVFYALDDEHIAMLYRGGLEHVSHS